MKLKLINIDIHSDWYRICSTVNRNVRAGMLGLNTLFSQLDNVVIDRDTTNL